MKRINNVTVLNENELREIQGGSILTRFTEGVCFLAAKMCKSYASMHESELTAYRHKNKERGCLKSF